MPAVELYILYGNLDAGRRSFYWSNIPRGHGLLVSSYLCVSEWYFLEFYMILKAIPNKNAGFMIMFSSIFYIFIQSEPKGINLISLLFIGHISILFIFLIIFYFLWIGAQLPQEQFIYYGRFLILLYIIKPCLGTSMKVYINPSFCNF